MYEAPLESSGVLDGAGEFCEEHC